MNDSKHASTEEQTIAEKAHHAREVVEDRVREFEQTYDEARNQLQKYNEQAIHFIRENPGVCIIGAVAAGYLIGRLASRRWLT
jgi:ElaB/YqjD/DUF883 family membrane-anchored ribosome-binding protein